MSNQNNQKEIEKRLKKAKNGNYIQCKSANSEEITYGDLVAIDWDKRVLILENLDDNKEFEVKIDEIINLDGSEIDFKSC